jgi:hypothetical protein
MVRLTGFWPTIAAVESDPGGWLVVRELLLVLKRAKRHRVQADPLRAPRPPSMPTPAVHDTPPLAERRIALDERQKSMVSTDLYRAA